MSVTGAYRTTSLSKGLSVSSSLDCVENAVYTGKILLYAIQLPVKANFSSQTQTRSIMTSSALSVFHYNKLVTYRRDDGVISCLLTCLCIWKLKLAVAGIASGPLPA